MELIFTKFIETLSLEYMFSVIVASYLLIKVLTALKGNVKSWAKCLVTCVVGVVLFGVFLKFTDETFECLMASFFAAVFLYDKAVKAIIEKFNLGYKKE